MTVWFKEYHTPNTYFAFEIKEHLYSERSAYQQIDIYQTADFGRVLVLDGYINVTEKDEFIYHEMITHVPLAVHPHVKRALVIGGGDGGTVRELLRYPEIEHIDLVEIDQMVVQAARTFLPFTSKCLVDPRVTIHYADGNKFLRQINHPYDLIIVDSTDPIGPGASLFTEDFYQTCFLALKADGILVNQCESPFYPLDALAMRKAYQKIDKFFPITKIYQFHLPTYPSGHWLFGFASKKWHPKHDIKKQIWEQRALQTNYYNTDVHLGSFSLPNYVQKLLA